MNYRNARILDHARHVEACTCCSRRDGSVVAAHSNYARHGKGGAMKAHDCFVAYLCRFCHDLVDAGRFSDEEACAIWMTGHVNSIPLFAHLLTAEGWRLINADHS